MSSDLADDIRRALDHVENTQREQEQRASKIDRPVPAANVRYFVTKWALWSYLGYAIGVGAYIMWKGESAQTAQLIDIMKTLLLPLVTLVLGFYFGSKAD